MHPAHLLFLFCLQTWSESQASNDLKLLQGEWEAVYVEATSLTTKVQFLNLRLLFEGKLLRWQMDDPFNPGKRQRASAKVLPRPWISPKRIDFYDRGQLIPALIYEATDNFLIIAISETDKDPLPKDFTPPDDRNRKVVVIFRKVRS
ncbi:hypothetical protein HRbin36_00310 [bacterium HR36]|nr:hypothetical protein HRbin36_00308 [bacterium HR36]GBD35204.1 hypothetical protein HRbin36_00310 [bacterium HR36]